MDQRISMRLLWEDATGFLLANREVALAMGLAFFFLPSLIAGLMVPPPSGNQMDDLGAMLPAILPLALIQTFGQVSLLALYLDPGRPTVGDAMRAALRLYPRAIVLAMLIGLVAGGGLLLLVLPGLYLAARLYPALALLVAEQRPIGETFVRAWQLTRGRAVWPILGFIGLAVLVLLLGQMLAQISIGTIGLMIGRLTGAEALGRIIGDVALSLVGAVIALVMVAAAGAAARRLSAGG